MRPVKLITQSLRFFWKRHLWLALGIAISTAVLTGALIVGDSVKYSLKTIVDKRLGNIDLALRSGDRYFTADLARKLATATDVSAAAVLRTDGSAVASGGKFRINDVRILGVDSTFDRMAGTKDLYGQLKEDEIVISSNLADRLEIGAGEEILVRMTRTSLIPLNAPFVSDADNIVTVRAKVKKLTAAGELGAFNLRHSQTAPYNIFINAGWLRELMEIGEKANLLLISGDAGDPEQVMHAVGAYWSLADAGLTMRSLPGQSGTEIISDRVFIDEAVADAVILGLPGVQPVITYFVNALSSGNRSTPYSFVTGIKRADLGTDGMLINQWLADDLGAGPGDSIAMEYFAVGPLRELEVRSATFRVAGVVPVEGGPGDRQMMPEIPGLSNAGNCRDWDTGVPVELDDIRDKDEDYWTRYKGTPKAYISLETARELWSNRFGTYTAFRIPSRSDAGESMDQQIMAAISPEDLGFEVSPVREEGNFAASKGVDFSQLFGGLSFFLLLGAILLSVLLFLLNMEERAGQVSTLRSLGIPFRTIRWMLVAEGMVVALAGAFLGILLSVVYNELIFNALNTIWSDIVRTRMLVVNIRIMTLLAGLLASLAVAFLSIYIPLGRFLKRPAAQQTHLPGKRSRLEKLSFPVGIVLLLAALGLVMVQLMGNDVYDPSTFFVSGGLFLVGGLLLFYGYMVRLRQGRNRAFDLPRLSMKNAIRNATRSLSILILFAIGTFLVISTGSNRKDLFVNADDRGSGTGGLLFFAESTTPVLQNLNDEEVRYSLGLGDGYRFVQMRIAEGDDASCLNLNRILNPRILATDPGELSGRFGFVTSIDMLDAQQPWRTLEQELPGGVIPAIADETVIKWGLGMSVGDTLLYQNASGEQLKLLLVGGLAPSIFQGNVIISEHHFIENFPSSSGTGVFLVEGPLADTAMIKDELELAMRDYGWSMTFTGKRLTEFYSVTNTYLSIFLVMGALGLLLGTVGLSIVLFRSTMERRKELALLRSVGYSMKQIRNLVFREYAALLSAGIFIGAVAAILATLPAFLSAHTGISLRFVLLILGVLLVNGLVWTRMMAGIALKNKSLSVALKND